MAGDFVARLNAAIEKCMWLEYVGTGEIVSLVKADDAVNAVLDVLGETRQEWGVQHELLGTEYVPGMEAARHLRRERNAGMPHRPWRLVKRAVGEWKEVEDGA